MSTKQLKIRTFALLVIMAIIAAAGCSSGGGGGNPGGGGGDADLYNAIKLEVQMEAARRGLVNNPTNDRDTRQYKAADGIIGNDYRYWQYPQGKIGGLTYGRIDTGPSRIVMPISPDGTFSLAVFRHEIGHAVNNDRIHIDDPATNGHPPQLKWLPWWPYYTGGGADVRYTLTPMVQELEDGNAMCIMFVEPAEIARGILYRDVEKLAKKLIKDFDLEETE